MSDLVVVIDSASNTVIEANENGCRDLGWSVGEVIGREVRHLVHPDDRSALTDLEIEGRGATATRTEQRWRQGSGGWRLYDVYIRAVGDNRLLVCGRDLSRLTRVQEQLTDLLRLGELTDDGLIVSDGHGIVRYANSAASRLHRSRSADLIGQPLSDFEPNGGGGQRHRIVEEASKNDRGAQGQVALIRADGSRAELRVDIVRDTGTGHWYHVERDVTESVAREEKLKKLNSELREAATTDHLTGLANRALLTRELQAALQKGTPVALALLDIDSFKLVNDSLGHTYGDQLLRFAADRLVARARPHDVVARFGGDEFLILMPDVSADQAVQRCDEIRHHLAEPYEIMGRLVHSSCSVGITMVDPEWDTAGDVFRNADIATYKAKDQGRNSCVLFDAQLREQIQQRFELEADLHQALIGDEIAVALQGIFDANDRSLVAFEALARWRHPVKGQVPPWEFVDIAEDCGLLDAISERVLTKSLEHLASWLRGGGKLTVNFAPSQLAATDMPDRLLALLDVFDVPPGAIVVEITEVGLTGAIDPAMPVLLRLREAGFQLAIDDFGKGASSLGYIRDLPITVVKIDGSFVHNLANDSFAATIISSVIELTDRLGLAAVAECIETEEQLRLVADMGCHRVQGFLLHEPSSPLEALDLIARHQLVPADSRRGAVDPG